VDSDKQSKRNLRAQLRRDRDLAYSSESWVHLVQSREIQNAKIVATYISYGTEPQTTDINEALFREGKSVLIPSTLKDKSIEWKVWDGSHKSLKRNGKVLESTGEIFTELNQIEVVIVPSLCIDREGNRIGQGGGSYDRALAKLSAWKVGLVGAGELTQQQLPTESHDQRLDAAATPTLLLRFSRGA
jgi:5-formyltetrahydrofolate cyclo-ligase